MENITSNPPTGAQDQEKYQRAKARVAVLRGFYIHLMVYMAVNSGLFALNLLESRGGHWWQWSAFWWGIGLAAHAASVFIFPAFLNKEWEERKIREIMSKDA